MFHFNLNIFFSVRGKELFLLSVPKLRSASKKMRLCSLFILRISLSSFCTFMNSLSVILSRPIIFVNIILHFRRSVKNGGTFPRAGRMSCKAVTRGFVGSLPELRANLQFIQITTVICIYCLYACTKQTADFSITRKKSAKRCKNRIFILTFCNEYCIIITRNRKFGKTRETLRRKAKGSVIMCVIK